MTVGQGRQVEIIRTSELEVGMYVMLPTGWLTHPFFRNEFRLSSEKEIGKIREAGFTAVRVDLSRSRVVKSKSSPSAPMSGTSGGAAAPASIRMSGRMSGGMSGGMSGSHSGAKSADHPVGSSGGSSGGTAGGQSEQAGATAPKPEPIAPPVKWKPEEIVPDELRAALKDKSLAPAEKASAIKNSTLMLMDRILGDPSEANLKEAKKGITEVVDYVVSDDLTSNYIVSITSHDLYTYTHSVNVGFYALLLAKSLFKGSVIHNMREIGSGFFFHDIGKVNIDPKILNKPGRLDEAEMALVRKHPVDGARILAKSHQLSEEVNTIVMQHHERADGTGYPLNLKGKAIHLYARICSIADVYDALTSERSYKKKLSPSDALKLMHEEMIGHFQTELFDRFVRTLG